MRKSTITRTWLWSLAAIIGGLIVGGIGMALLFTTGSWTQTGTGSYELTSLSGIAWVWGVVMGLGGLCVAIGGIGQLVAWIMAMVLTYRIHQMTWFLILLVLGLIGFGFIAMLAYVLAGPNETQVGAAPPTQQPTQPQPPSTYVPTS